MSFFERLIVASLGGAPGLRPLPTSRFAPAMASDEAPFEQSAVVEAALPRAPEHDAERPRRAPRPRLSATEPPPIAAPRRTAPLERSAAAAPPSLTSSATATSGGLEPPAPVDTFAAPLRSAWTHDAPLPTDADAPLLPAQAAAAGHDDAELPSLRARGRRDEREHDGAAAATVSRAEAASRHPSRPRSSPAAAAADGAPDIHVTIGRIDVRALLPAAPSPRSPSGPSRPRLSLDQYLSERGRR